MKNAILISGRPGSGKTKLVNEIKKQFTRADFLQPLNPQFKWIKPETDVIIIEGVSEIAQLQSFTRFLEKGEVKVRKGELLFKVSPFYIFTSQSVRLLPAELIKLIAHIDCYDGGVCMVNLKHLPEKVIEAIHRHAEKPSRMGLSSAETPIKKGVL